MSDHQSIPKTRGINELFSVAIQDSFDRFQNLSSSIWKCDGLEYTSSKCLVLIIYVRHRKRCDKDLIFVTRNPFNEHKLKKHHKKNS